MRIVTFYSMSLNLLCLLQNSALLPFLQFYSEFTERKNYENCKLLLNEFKLAMFIAEFCLTSLSTVLF